jgi:ribonuclease HI
MDKFLIITKPVYEQGDFASLYTDGACRGNGGKKSVSGAGAVLFDQDSNVMSECREYLGLGLTNNIAEYKGLILGLKEALKLNIKVIEVFVDSKLICQQIRGDYKVKKPHLRLLFDEVKLLIEQFEKFKIVSILRHLNKHADRLANESIDQRNQRNQRNSPNVGHKSNNRTKNTDKQKAEDCETKKCECNCGEQRQSIRTRSPRKPRPDPE